MGTFLKLAGQTMIKRYKIIQFFSNETKKEAIQKKKPSLTDLLRLLYYAKNPQTDPSCTCVQVLINEFMKFDNVLGIELKFIPAEGILVQIFNLNPVRRALKTVSKFFMISFEKYRKITV